MFNQIMTLKSTKVIYDFLQAEYKGDDRNRGMKTLNLIWEFEQPKKDGVKNHKALLL